MAKLRTYDRGSGETEGVGGFHFPFIATTKLGHPPPNWVLRFYLCEGPVPQLLSVPRSAWRRSQQLPHDMVTTCYTAALLPFLSHFPSILLEKDLKAVGGVSHSSCQTRQDFPDKHGCQIARCSFLSVISLVIS